MAAIETSSGPSRWQGECGPVVRVDQNGYTIAHPNPMFVGRDPSLRVDATGYFYGDDLLGATDVG